METSRRASTSFEKGKYHRWEEGEGRTNDKL